MLLVTNLLGIEISTIIWNRQLTYFLKTINPTKIIRVHLLEIVHS